MAKCRDCEFCFPVGEEGFVCASENYGDNITETLNQVKECYSEGLEKFVERAKSEEVMFPGNTTLASIKIDGRSRISLLDLEGKVIDVKASQAKKMFGEIIVLKRSFKTDYYVDAVFSPEPFKGGRVIVLK